VFRLSTRADPAFLAEILYEAVYWRDDGAEERPSLEALLAMPEHARFVEGWGRPGDVAVLVLDRRDEPVGAAWYRCFGAPGDGVADMTIAVYGEFRRQGVGSLLLGALLARSSAYGERALRVKIDHDNPGRRFLARNGFEDDPANGTMVYEHAPDAWDD
jgi:GNAT superfamily N-acetyltransferase